MGLNSHSLEESAEEEYGTVENLFQMEDLGNNFDEVRHQVETIEQLILKLEDLNRKLRNDPDMDQYVDECMMSIDDAFKNFQINGKVIDIGALSGKTGARQIYNSVVCDINDYIEQFMFGHSRPDLLRTL